MLDKFKRYMLRGLLDRENDGSKALNFNQVRSVGLVDFIETEADVERSMKVEKFVRDEYGIREVHAFRFSYLKPDKVEGMPVLSKKDFKWTGKPVGEQVQSFVRHEFDLLIDLTQQTEIASNFIMSNTKAAVKAGFKTPEDQKPYDLLMDIDPKSPKTTLITELVAVLKMINAK